MDFNEYTRRDFLKTLGLGAATMALPGCLGTTSPQNRPNIVLIMADDMGFSDLGCYGGEIETPNLDRLADNGLRFTHFYNAAKCCPTRASLLTGLYQHQAGVGDMDHDLGYPEYQGYLNDRCVTIAEALKQAGYATYMSGKWHIGKEPQNWPRKRGFDRYFGLINGANSFWEILPGRTMALDDTPWEPDPDDDSFYMTDAFTDNAIDFLDTHPTKDKPFFLYMAHTAPHWPLHAWPEDIAKYRNKYKMGWDALRKQRHERMIEMGIVDEKWALSPRHEKVPSWDSVADKDVQDLRMAVYAAMIDRMDQGIGRVLDKIKQMGAEENTLVMFLSDNGASQIMVNRGEPGIPPGPKGGFWGYDYPWANAGSTPLRKFKRFAHEGGISTPLICSWPKGIKPKNRLTHQVGHIIDVMPTVLDIAGIQHPEESHGKSLLPLEGQSLLPVFKGNQSNEPRTLFWEHMGHKAVRDGKWKLVLDRHRQVWELYDLEADRTELNDLSAQFPEKVAVLKTKWETWAERCGVLPWPLEKTK